MPRPAPTMDLPTPPNLAAGSVMEAFQATMRTFLEVQQATMLAYLGRRGALADVVPAAPSPRIEAPEATATPPPTPEPLPVVAIPAATAPEPSARGSIVGRLVAIVKDRTGYPAEMLRLDLDLEADLGIDSIKRIEILGTLRDSLAGLDGASDSTLMDALARAKTLGEVVDRVEKALGTRPRDPEPEPDPRPTPPAPSRGEATSTTPAAPVRRYILEPVEATLRGESGGLASGGVVVVTDDGRGVAHAIGETLRAEGHPVAVIEPGRVDLTSPAAIEATLARVREIGPIVGVVHALPLRATNAGDADPGGWAGRFALEARGLFLLARAAAGDLDAASRRGGSCLIAATAMGGGFASAGTDPEGFFPGQGGVAGLVKTLAREWPAVRVRVVDLDPAEPTGALAAVLAAEALADDGWAEVGILRGRRVRLNAVPAPLDPGARGFALAKGEPVLVTGGARGITAAVALELARRWRPTLLLVGASPMPDQAEDAATDGLTAPPALKAALLGRLRRDGREVAPADLERAYQALVSAREIRATLGAIRAAGSAVDYARADVRDAEALARALDGWRRRFGDPVGLIHGAGVIHDKLIRDKSPASFDRVVGPKLLGALNLVRLVRPEPLRFTALFSSIAGRFGNAGQADYAAANDALNKLAVWLDGRWPGRVVSIGWGPWAGVGMVSELAGHLGRRGLGLIRPEVGAAAFADELRLGRKGDVEVIISGELGTLDAPLRRPGRAPLGVAR